MSRASPRASEQRSSVIQVFASDRQRLHDPEHEIESSALQAPFEHPGRAAAIRAALAADPTFAHLRAGGPATLAPIEAVHDPGLVRFLATAWAEYQRDVHPAHDVVARRVRDARAARRDGTGPGADGRRRPPRLVVLRDDDAADGGARTRPPGRPSTARSPPPTPCSPATRARLRPVPSARSPRHDVAVRRLLLLQQRGDRRRPRRLDAGAGGSPCSTSTTTTATARSRSSTSATTCSSCRCTVTRRGPTRTSPGTPTRSAPGAGAGQPATCRCLPAPTTTPTLPPSSGRWTRSTPFDPALVIVSLGVDTFVDDPICDLALTTDGFGRVRRCRRRARPAARRAAGRRLRRRRARRQRQLVAARRDVAMTPTSWRERSRW